MIFGWKVDTTTQAVVVKKEVKQFALCESIGRCYITIQPLVCKLYDSRRQTEPARVGLLRLREVGDVCLASSPSSSSSGLVAAYTQTILSQHQLQIHKMKVITMHKSFFIQGDEFIKGQVVLVTIFEVE